MPVDVWVFIEKNLFLFIVCVVSGAMLLWPLVQRLMVGGKDVTVQEAVQLINRRDAVVLDVRNASEYAAGHIPNARHIPAGEIEKRLKELDKLKSRPIVVSDQSGKRAAAACALLKKNGFAEVFPLKGGVLGWQQAAMPIEK
jgi:rhodanese-related sulfurtransferase